MPNLEVPPITNLDELIDVIRATPFPEDAKVRLSITGLAFCILDRNESSINFLSHVDSHELQLAVIKRVRRTGAVYPVRMYTILPGDKLYLKVLGSRQPGSINAVGNYPLDEMVNLYEKHGNKQIKYIGPTDEDHPHYPTVLSIKHAAFNTMAVHSKLFTFREHGMSDPLFPPDEIGYIMGGAIETPNTGTGDVRLTSAKDSFESPLALSGVESEEVVYDIIFDNHCKPAEKKVCNTKVADHGGEKGTDFFYYYDVLREEGNMYRQLCLEHLEAPVIPEADPPPPPDDGNGGGEGDTSARQRSSRIGLQREPPGGSGEVAACNPIIVEPPPS